MKGYSGRFYSSVVHSIRFLLPALLAAGIFGQTDAQSKLLKLSSPVIFRGDSLTAYRDPAILFHDKVFYLFFTLVEIEKDGKVFSYTASSTSRDLLQWTRPVKITPRDQSLNYSSPGNIINYRGEWILCLQTYPRPGQLITQPVRYGDASARLYIMRSKDLRKWSLPELLRVKGNKVAISEMGRMIDPYLVEDKDEKGKYWCFYKQKGVSMSYSYDLVNWTFHGFTDSGENTCVLTENNEYILFHSPSNGIGIKKSTDLKTWYSWGNLITLGQDHWDWARGRITAGTVIDLRHIKGIERYIMFFHGSGPRRESEGDFDRNASIGIAWSSNLAEWEWPGKSGEPAVTKVSVEGEKWFFNGRPVNEGSPAEGLLMNVRMVNSVFEDTGKKMPAEHAGFDSEENASEFVKKIPEYVASGVNCFTISLQGGAPGYEGSVNTAFEPDGSLRQDYMNRVLRVIRAANQNGAAVILSCLYQRQHSHSQALDGREAIRNAVVNTAKWIRMNGLRNVILEVSNEYRHGGYRNWKDGSWLISASAQSELIKLAKSVSPDLITGTSGMGDGSMKDSIAAVADYITIHFNNTSLGDYAAKIEAMRKYGKPVICNEDDKLGRAGASALVLSVMNKCGWGYMNSRKNQTIPFGFEGAADDTAVYAMFRKVTTKGYRLDESSLAGSSLIITTPNDGDIFTSGSRITVRYSYLFPVNTSNIKMKLFDNGKVLSDADPKAGQVIVAIGNAGVHYLHLEVTDDSGNVVVRSPRVDVIIK